MCLESTKKIENEKYVLDRVVSAGGGALFEDFADFPRYILLETVNNCTARCPMCGIEEWRKRIKANYMEDMLFFKVVDEIIAHREIVQKIALFVGNEPLLDRKLAQRIRYLKENGIKKVNFSTNGSLMDYNRAIEILESRVDHVNVSIDSLDKSVYEAMRRPLKFEKVLGNALQFINLRNAMNFKTAIRISVIKNSRLFKDKDINEVKDFWFKFLDKDKGDSIRIDELHESFKDKESDISSLMYDNEKRGCTWKKYDSTPCYTLWNTITIKADGQVALCCVDQCRQFTLGNLQNESIAENWKNNKTRNLIKEKHLMKGRGCVDVCKNCIAWL